jgi:putative endonuclease
MSNTRYSVYILRCNDDTYYTGIATDVERRVAEHHGTARGAKYLQGRGPLTLVYSAAVGDRSRASKVEYRIKQLDRKTKEALIAGHMSLPDIDANQDSDAG